MRRDNGLTWFDPGGTIAGIHAGVVQLNDSRLLAFGRGDNIDGKMPKSISSNMGQTWAYSASEFPPIGGGQRLVLRRLKEGPILFVSFTDLGDGMVINGQRVYGMFAAVSYDEGLTWPVKKLVTAGGPPQELDGGGNTHWFTMDDTHAEPRGYLAATQTPDGVIHLISSALHYQFNLAWLLHKD
ncbi:MAG: sialidase family protein, partial [Planctomycetota bacterium]